MVKKIVIFGLVLLMSISACADSPISNELRNDLQVFFDDICEWIISMDLGSGTLKTSDDASNGVFINGNLARILIASYRMTGNKKHLAEAVKWFDCLVDQQQLVITSKLNQGGYWQDAPAMKDRHLGNIYFGDAGTAATALAVGYRHVDAARKKIYLEAIQRYARFAIEGCLNDPQRLGRKPCDGWIIKSGKEKGAMGVGYYRGKLHTKAYLSSTATTGAAFFAQIYDLTGNKEYKKVSLGASKFMLDIITDEGIIPPTPPDVWLAEKPLHKINYATEGWLNTYKYAADEEFKKYMEQKVKPTVVWSVENQNADGSWGQSRSPDQVRSQGILTLLFWYYTEVEQCPEARQAIVKYCEFLTNPVKAKEHGIKELLRTTEFTALAVAEILKPGCSF